MDAVTLNQLIKAAWDEWHSDIDEDCRPSVPNKSFEMGVKIGVKLAEKLWPSPARWKPISEAPRTGKWIAIIGEWEGARIEPVLVRWDDFKRMWVNEDNDVIALAYAPEKRRFTHFFELPELPEVVG